MEFPGPVARLEGTALGDIIPTRAQAVLPSVDQRDT